jgi:FkbM family methyltransferase
VVDGGAHKGTFTDAFLQLHAPERLVLVEPNPRLVEQLKRKYADRSGIEVAPFALAGSSGTAEFNLNRWSAASSLLPINPRSSGWFGRALDVTGTTKVSTLSLRDFMEQYRLAAIDLLKLDLQGAESLVLRSAETVLPAINAIYTEVFFEPLYDGAELFFDLWAFLRERAFTLCGLTNIAHGRNGDLLQANAIFRNNKAK